MVGGKLQQNEDKYGKLFVSENEGKREGGREEGRREIRGRIVAPSPLKVKTTLRYFFGREGIGFYIKPCLSILITLMAKV